MVASLAGPAATRRRLLLVRASFATDRVIRRRSIRMIYAGPPVSRMSLVALSKVGDRDAGVASSLLNTGQQVGGSIGLAILGTVAWSAVANSIHSQAAAAAAAARHATVHLSAAQQAALQKVMTDHAFSVGFSKGYVVSAGIALLGLIVTLLAIRVKREDLSGINPMAAPTD